MRFLFFILFLASFTASANPDSSQFASMAQELDYILTKIEEREQMGAQETTYVYMRGTYNTQLASTAKNKTPISEQAIKEADSYLYQLDTIGRKTIMFYTYMFYSEKENNKFNYKTTIEKTFDDLFAKRDGTGKVNVLINIMVYNQKLTDLASQYSFNLYIDKMRQSYELEDGLEKAVQTALNKEIKNKTGNRMSRDCNKALVFRSKLLLEKVKGWKKSTGMLNAGILKDIFPGTAISRLKEVAGIINKYQNQFGLNTPVRMAHFLGQTGHETGNFKGNGFKEETRYPSNNPNWDIWFNKTWAETPLNISACNDIVSGGKKTGWNSIDDVPKKYVSDGGVVSSKQAGINLFSYVYRCEGGHGDEASLDGYKYRGHGIIHLTWKKQYVEFNKWMIAQGFSSDYKKLLSNPDLAFEDFEISCLSGLWYWKINNGNEKADAANDTLAQNFNSKYLLVSKAVNKQAVDNNNRKTIFKKALRVLNN